ncbi:MAG: Crp/Fnr family transcriptional regulator [Gracilibacteraceae bacterium]|jgi:CRP/FNR family transcriptional regulator|nr:Crp/Fnr family transcriptional regulator [Gracilibacteraceae bacterium]
MTETNLHRALPADFCPIESLERFQAYGCVRRYQKGSFIAWPGEHSHQIIYVLSGRLVVGRLLAAGEEHLIYHAGRHCIVGRMFDVRDDDSYFVRALEDSRCCFFSREQLTEIFQQDMEMAFDIIKNYYSKVSYYMNQLTEIRIYPPPQRLIRMLRDLFREKGCLEDGAVLPIQLTQQDITAITGIHYVSVSRILKNLKEAGILTKTRSRLVLHDAARLNSLALSEK